MSYARLKDDEWELIPRPRWYADADGTPVSDETLAEHDIYPTQHDRPAYDHESEYLLRDDPAAWQLIDGVVVIGYSIASYDPEEVWQRRREGVLAERERRLAMGFDYDFGDERGVHHVGTTAADEKGWQQVDRWAAAATGLGDTASTLLIVTDTGPTYVSAADWHAIVAHGATVQQPIWQASFALQAMIPIPADYTDDLYWSTP